MADYSDQFLSDDQFTMNMCYKCNASRTWDNPGGCRAVGRAGRWTQLHSLEETAGGRCGQRWCRRCGARYLATYGACVEMIDRAAQPPKA
eukprot:1077174-Pyramimonas_sp.AAC.1